MMAEGALKIVWPPVVVVENAGFGKDPQTRKFTGLENREVVATVNSMVEAIKLRRVIALYNHAGHTGRFFVLFPSDDAGYKDAVALHDAFEMRGRGRRDLKLGQKDEAGKLILYGYLATEEDMNKLDKDKKVVKRWSVEDYEKVILEPQVKRMKESQDNRCLVVDLVKNVEEKEAFIEQEKAELEQIRLEIKQQKELEEADQRRQEEAKAKHEQQMRELRQKLEVQRADRRKVLMEKIEALKAMNWQNHLAELTKASQEKMLLEGNIDKQKEENEKMKVEIQALERAIKHNDVLESVKNQHADKLSTLKSRQAEELFELRRRYAEKKKRLVQEALAKSRELDEQLKKADEDCKDMECAVCLEEFDEGGERKRALYLGCGHIRVCLHCARRTWEQSKCCPVCNTEQESQPVEYKKLYF